MQTQDWLYARQQEVHTLRQNGNFVGWLFLAMIGVQAVVQAAVALGAFSGLVSSLGTHEGIMVLNMVLYIVELAVPTVAVALLTGRRRSPFPTKRVNGAVWFVGFWGGMALAIVANLVTGWIMQWLSSFGVPQPELPQTVLPTYSSLLVNLIATAVLPAIVEEMIFRGYMLGALRAHGDSLAIVITAVLFGVFHGNILQMPFAIILGLVMGYLTVLTDCIWPAVLLHFSNNAMSVLLNFFGERYPDYAGDINGITFLIVAAIGAVVLTVLLQQQDMLTPVGNGYSPLRVRERESSLLTAPALLVAQVLMVITLLRSIGGAA